MGVLLRCVQTCPYTGACVCRCALIWNAGVTFLRKRGHRRSPPSRPRFPGAGGCGSWAPGRAEGDPQVLLSAPMTATSPCQHCPGAEGAKGLEAKGLEARHQRQRAGPTGTLPARPRSQPSQCHRGPARDTGTAEMCSATERREGVTHCPRPQANSSGP